MPRAPRSPLAPRKRPRQARARATVEAILEATARILVRRGWAGTTTNHVAECAGVSVGTLYEYFPSKEALVHALVTRHLDEAEARLSALASGLATEPPSLEGLVRAIVATMLELHEAAPRLHRVLFDEVPHPPAIRARVRAIEEAQTDALAAVLPRLTEIEEPRVTAQVIVALLEALAHRWVLTPGADPLPRVRMQAELERLVLGYLAAS
ncbi:MAG: TetR/AcrR family transcriptional regulator [Polyangiaceae bacterium]